MSKCYYFIGIGGIGMSALARYFLSMGMQVGGYDLTESALTRALSQEGAWVHYRDDIAELPPPFLDPAQTTVIYTPAVPQDHSELSWFRAQGFEVIKRSQALGIITRMQRALCVAGTHGKTTTSTMLAFLLHESKVGCNAFLGGISNNLRSNLILNKASDLVVVEADEYDRSFHRLHPYQAIITSTEEDHLDIYGDRKSYLESFEHFARLIPRDGALVIHKDAMLSEQPAKALESLECTVYSYAINDRAADFSASDIEVIDGRLFFRWHYPPLQGREGGSLKLELGSPLLINVSNATAALALAYMNGASLEELEGALPRFRGAARRFDVVLRHHSTVLIDDYAHHPTELKYSIDSIRFLFPQKKVVGVFQPHLFSRTQDFFLEFAESLASLDEVILLPIYPAREKPIEGVSSELIGREICRLEPQKSVLLLEKEGYLDWVRKADLKDSILLMVGAGDIDRLVQPTAEIIQEQNG